jgi:hypothetical protein
VSLFPILTRQFDSVNRHKHKKNMDWNTIILLTILGLLMLLYIIRTVAIQPIKNQEYVDRYKNVIPFEEDTGYEFHDWRLKR